MLFFSRKVSTWGIFWRIKDWKSNGWDWKGRQKRTNIGWEWLGFFSSIVSPWNCSEVVQGIAISKSQLGEFRLMEFGRHVPPMLSEQKNQIHPSIPFKICIQLMKLITFQESWNSDVSRMTPRHLPKQTLNGWLVQPEIASWEQGLRRPDMTRKRLLKAFKVQWAIPTLARKFERTMYVERTAPPNLPK